MKEVINLLYNRHAKEWYHKAEKLSDIENYENNLFSSINEIVTMIEYINFFSYTDIYNLLNVLPITLVTKNNNTYMYIDFTNPIIQLNKYDVKKVIHHQSFNKLPPLQSTQANSDERSSKSLNKLFIMKVEKNGDIKKQAVIYNYLFTFIKLISGIEYTSDIGTVADYIKLADMNRI